MDERALSAKASSARLTVLAFGRIDSKSKASSSEKVVRDDPCTVEKAAGPKSFHVTRAQPKHQKFRKGCRRPNHHDPMMKIRPFLHQIGTFCTSTAAHLPAATPA